MDPGGKVKTLDVGDDNMTRRKCPKCGSTKVKRWGVPQTWSKWECHNCGYIGAVIIENGKVGFREGGAEKKRRDQYQAFRKGGKGFH